MPTQRLYHDDTRLVRFEASIVRVDEDERGSWVELDATAFYPTSGGQPFDTGSINGIPVVEVEDREDRILHRLAQPLVEGRARGVVDWERRFDHMQQHTAQHVLTRVLLDAHGVRTIGFHLGDAVSNIDLDRAGLTDDVWVDVEERVAAIIRAARPVHVSYTTSEEAPSLGLRKIPPGHDRLRVITIEGVDATACGGTHLAGTHEIESLKLLGTENVGARHRLYYVAGGRARRDHRTKHDIVTKLSARLSTSAIDLESAFDRKLGELEDARRSMRHRQRELARHHLERWCAGLAEPRVIVRRLGAGDLDAAAYAEALGQTAGTVLLLGWVASDRANLLFARSADVPIDLPPVLAAALRLIDGRGGGGPSRAQGAGPGVAGLDEALAGAKTACERALSGGSFA